VHRLLQATLDENVEDYPMTPEAINQLCDHCSEKQQASKEAQLRCDRVYLAIFLKNHPLAAVMGVVLSVGSKAFTVFIPELGAEALVYLDEHKETLTWTANEEEESGVRKLFLHQKLDDSQENFRWKQMEIAVFEKVKVDVICKEKPPIGIKARFVAPFTSP
jgi:exoribonuclease R